MAVKAKEIFNSAPKSQNDKIKSFKKSIMKAYVACSQALQKKIPINNDFLKCVSTIDPMCRRNCVTLKVMKQLPQSMPNILLPEEKELFDLKVQKCNADSLHIVNEGGSINE